MSFFGELKRRNVIRVGAAYVVAAWLLIQVAETIFPLFGYGDGPARIVVVVLAIGFLPVLIFAWAFELTPEGLKKESEVDRSESITPQTGRKLDRAIMVVLVIALGYFAFDKFVLSEYREATMVESARQAGRSEALVESYGDKSIAVLPFVNMSDDASNEYFSDGISEELLNLLAKIPELRVISRSSAFSYKGKDIKLAQVADELNVAHVLEGSVRKTGNRVRITAQLIEARSDTHLWSQTYDRELDDIFATQDEIAASVVEQLKITLLGTVPKVQETDPEAYALYLQARHLGRQMTAESLGQSNVLYERALAIDPDYAAAWNGLARNYGNMARSDPLLADETSTKVREAAEKALAIDPDFAPAHATLGLNVITFDNDLAAAARHFGRALELDPADLAVLSNAVLLLQALGRLDQAIEVGEFLVARDPVNPTAHYNLGLGYLWESRWDEAIASFEICLHLSPGSGGTQYSIGEALLFKGEAEAALEAFAREEEVYRVKGQALALHALGRKEEHEQKLQQLIERWGDEWPSEVAQVYAYRGDVDRTFAWLDRAIEQDEGGMGWQFLLPYYKAVHGDPRWASFLKRVGSAPEQLDAIEFEVTLLP